MTEGDAAFGHVVRGDFQRNFIAGENSDDRLTEAVKKAAETLDIRLVDHVIVAGNNYYSYADEGRLQNR